VNEFNRNQDFVLEQYTENQSAYGKLFDADKFYYNTIYSFIARDLYKWLRSQTPDNYVE